MCLDKIFYVTYLHENLPKFVPFYNSISDRSYSGNAWFSSSCFNAALGDLLGFLEISAAIQKQIKVWIEELRRMYGDIQKKQHAKLSSFWRLQVRWRLISCCLRYVEHLDNIHEVYQLKLQIIGNCQCFLRQLKSFSIRD